MRSKSGCGGIDGWSQLALRDTEQQWGRADRLTLPRRHFLLPGRLNEGHDSARTTSQLHFLFPLRISKCQAEHLTQKDFFLLVLKYCMDKIKGKHTQPMWQTIAINVCERSGFSAAFWSTKNHHTLSYSHWHPSPFLLPCFRKILIPV